MKKTLKKLVSVLLSILIVVSSASVAGISANAATSVAVPKGVTVKAKTDTLTISFKKVIGAKGYIINYSTSKKFSKSSTKKAVIKVTSKTSNNKLYQKTVKGLSSGKNYYVRVRAYKVINGKKTYSKWSKTVKKATAKVTKPQVIIPVEEKREEVKSDEEDTTPSGSSGGAAGPTSNPVNITLNASKIELSVGDDGIVIFYATLDGKASEVILVNKTKNSNTKMVDDGLYSESGDDLPGDGVFSAIAYIDTSVEKTYDYYVKVGNYVSNTISIRVIDGFTSQQMTNIENVEYSLENIFNTPSYDDLSISERKDIAEDVIDNMVSNNLIKDDSVYYNDNSQTYTFMYESGILGTVVLKEETDTSDTATNSIGTSSEYAYPIEEPVNFGTSSQFGTASVSDMKAIVLWSFCQSWDTESFRKPFYQSLKSEFDQKGLSTTVKFDATVDDYKDLSDYKVIMISGHGSYNTFTYGSETRSYSELLLHEYATSSKINSRVNDLKGFRLALCSNQEGTFFEILPNFFSYYYSGGKLNGSFVYAENCEFYGKDNNVVNTMADAFVKDASVSAVIGFHNSVLANYSRLLMKEYVNGLINGKTAGASFDYAKNVYGSSDGNIAYPIFTGNKNAKLIPDGILNGDFEESTSLIYWEKLGDARVITTLGPLMPSKNSKMGIITTGIGSADGEATSSIRQTFVVPKGAYGIGFNYNVVSEEPMEYVGTKYDDTFVVTLYDAKGNVIKELAKETVNEAEWHSVSGINFDGGDDTTYQTGWVDKYISNVLLNYQGEKVTIEFKVYDKGDSVYDTAVLIDNVRFDV